MKQEQSHDFSLSDVHGSVEISSSGSRLKRLFAFFGPAYLVSVGYMDPGNWATDIAGGSKFGYSLLWVLLMSNFMALLLQSFAARLGIVRGRDLAQANREAYPKLVNFCLYILAEIAITACDLAEVLGMAIGLQLLTGLPLIWGVCLTALDTFLLLFLQKLGMRKMEAFIITLIGIVSISFLMEIVMAKPQLGDIARGFVPILQNREALYIAIGIIGATVMPHNLYLHSALVQTRKIQRTDENIRRSLKLNFWDSTIALNLAFFVNAAILILAATVFFQHGKTGVASIREAHQLLPQQLGTTWSSRLFAIALIAAGQSSTITGTLAGQIIMEGHLRLRINPLLRRVITRMLAIVPAILVISLSGENQVDQLLVFSQVILSLQLGFAVVPLIHFVSSKKDMGNFSISLVTRFFGWGIAALLIYLNMKLVIEETAVFYATPGNIGWKLLLTAAALGAITLLAYVFIHPWLQRNSERKESLVHATATTLLPPLEIPHFRKIAIALDFSKKDPKLLSYAVGQGGSDCHFILIHVVESASARILGNYSDDYETRNDEERLNLYKANLENGGYQAVARLGYKNRSAEIVRIVNEEKADMLVVGAHGHTGLKDFIFGETVNTVRHELKIPVLIVSL